MEALYRKYRPTTFKDVVGQEHIERTLKNAIEQNKVSHAYLFCGPRGTGKTTMARILAKALLCEKGPTVEPDGTCSECEAIAQGTHPDVYELDAASRTGVDNVREEIIARVNYAPTRGAWKVYIIDEVHMLTNAAFNALLKTLEEPPAHILFILCTTDPQKVPDTIQSRCQRFDFHRISNEAIVSRLGAICVEEGVDFEGEALDLIAYRADGGMRNALTSLEQLIAFGDGHVTLEGAQNLLGSLDETDLSEIILAIGRRDAAACFNWVARYVETGADLAQFVSDLSEYVRNMYLLSMAGIEVEIPVNEATRKAMVDQLKYFGQERLSRLLVVLGDLSKELHSSSNPRLSFEIALTRMVRPESDLTIEALAERVEELERKIASGQIGAVTSVSSAAVPVSSIVDSTPSAVAQSAQSVTLASSTGALASSAATAPVQSATTHPAIPAQPAVSQAPLQQQQAQPAYQVETVASGASVYQAEPVLSGQVVHQEAVPTPTRPANQVSTSTSQVTNQVAATPQASAAPNAALAIDVTNPAAVQRFWHTVTSSLRKANPARGVLFMNAKISGESNGSGLVVTFAKDNGFAYTAAQKPEVQQLLSQTIDSVAGSHIPYRLVLEESGQVQGGIASTGVASAAPAQAQGMGNQAAQPQGFSNQPTQANQAASQAERVRAAIKAAQAANQAPQATNQAAQTANQMPQEVTHQTTQFGGQVPQVANQMTQSSNAAPQPQAPLQQNDSMMVPPAPSAPASHVAAAQQQPVVAPSYEEDQVPLEAYGNAFSAEEEPEQNQGGFAAETPQAQSYDQSYAQPQNQTGTQQASQPPMQTLQPVTDLETQSAQPEMRKTAQPTTQASSIAENDEAAQIKAILTNSFGEGIKFEELSE